MLNLFELSGSDSVIFFTTIASVIATSIVAYYFFRFYRISGIDHFLGIPTGFTFLSASNVIFGTSLLVESGKLTNMINWIWLITLSYSFSLIAMSYYYRSAEFNERTKLVRTMSYAAMPVLALVIGIEAMSLEQVLISARILDEYFTAFNLIALTYVIIQSVTAIKTGNNPKLYYIPFGFLLLWVGQLSILSWALFDLADAILIYALTNIGGPALFIYALHKYVLRRGSIAKTTKA